ncbi:alanine racemase [Breznakiella homolactica]|uniref:Alanine racemase n=1 Tax=Breznakiella homolactica TaxID=2798577 RepID=A0A7T7XLA2_9SPIR|nr:alanine racemase [Breznakiella homolactica]QQO08490.1 alanine racemase [Breznakiella homolactica]
MELTGNQLNEVETPCLIIDVEQARRNIESMQKAADAAGCALRPHIKTHKMPFFAKMQVEAGAKGITCAKVSEAEVMADAGIQDIFIAYPMVGDFRIRRAIDLAGRIGRLILAVDSLTGAEALDRAARKSGKRLEVWLEIDTGAGRTGIPVEDSPALAAAISKMDGLSLTGIYTFKSLVYQGKPTEDNTLAAREEGDMMARTADLIRAAGVPVQEISAGSSPTGEAVALTGKVTEIRPGTYIFKDVMLEKEGVAEPPELAVKYAATVVSCNHDGYAVIDGGTKTFPTDIPINTAPAFYPGYAVVEGSDHLRLSRMNEEHGIITSTTGKTGLTVGQKLTLLPIHVCTAINMQNSVYLLENNVLRRQTVDARGMLV